MMNDSKKRKERVFLAGTDDVKDILEHLESRLPELEYELIWFHKRFDVETEDTFDTCLENVKKCDRFILVLKERYGIPYNTSETYPDGSYKYSITEEEFMTAHRENIPILIFIYRNTFTQAGMYHKHRKHDKGYLEKNFSNLGYKAQMGLYEFIERLQHLKKEGKRKIRWIENYSYAEEILNQVKLKWKEDTSSSYSKDSISEIQRFKLQAYFNRFAIFLSKLSKNRLSAVEIKQTLQDLRFSEEKIYFGIEIYQKRKGFSNKIDIMGEKYIIMISSYMEGMKIQIQKENKNLLYSNFSNILEILVELKGYILSIYGYELKIPRDIPHCEVTLEGYEQMMKTSPLLKPMHISLLDFLELAFKNTGNYPFEVERYGIYINSDIKLKENLNDFLKPTKSFIHRINKMQLTHFLKAGEIKPPYKIQAFVKLRMGEIFFSKKVELDV